MDDYHSTKLKKALASPPPQLNDLIEAKHFCRIICAFNGYRKHFLSRINRNEKFLDTLPSRHQELLQTYRGRLEEFRKCIIENQELLNLIVKNVSSMFENIEPVPKEMINESQHLPDHSDFDKVQTTLKLFVRDWSVEGLEERKACYDPIIDAIVHNFPLEIATQVKVLVPGAGLGRLAFEIAKRGYSCEGNEFSLYMLFASNFILNKCKGVNVHHIYPWIHQFDNNLSANHQMERLLIPDINPENSIYYNAKFTMIAGDFLEIYKDDEEKWDCVATCFFIDCASNIVAFVEAIYKILKPGGFWINLGPLLYHFTNTMKPGSIEISYADLKEVITGFGFKFKKEKICVKTKYAQNRHSMLQNEYESVFFVCQKPPMCSPPLDKIIGVIIEGEKLL